MAEYAARLFSRSGIPAYPLNKTGIALAEQLINLSQGDVLIVMVQQSLHREATAALQEACRLDIPIIVITGQRKRELTRICDELIIVPRSSRNEMPLHGPTLACLEMLMLGVAAITPDQALGTLDRLLMLRQAIRGK